MSMKYGSDIRKAMLSGINQLADAVAITLGPKGRTVCMEKAFGSPLITKDGVSVAKEIELEDPWENLGARLVKGVSSKTSDDAGDGTTTATVLARYLYADGLKLVEAGIAPVALKRGMDKALVLVKNEILGISSPVSAQSDIENVATISANGDSAIGKIVAEAVSKVGKDGVVNIEEGKSTVTTLEATDGMQFDRGWVNPHFMLNQEGQESILEDPLIFVTDRPLSAMRPMQKLLEAIVETNRPVLWIAPDFDGEALPTMAQNLSMKVLTSVPVKAPGFGATQTEILKDICALTGANFISKELGMTHDDKITIEDLGTARSVRITAKNTTIVDGGGSQEEVDARLAHIRGQISRSSSEFDSEKLRERAGKLQGGICVIKVGASSELALKEIKARMEDALYATKASIDEGVVPGGGVTLLRAAKHVEDTIEKAKKHKGTLPYPIPGVNDSDEWAGFRLVLKACEEPFRQILRNAGEGSSVHVARVRKEKSDFFGVDATNMTYKNLVVAGILDPAKVVRCAITNAVSVVGTLLTTECAIHKEVKNLA